MNYAPVNNGECIIRRRLPFGTYLFKFGRRQTKPERGKRFSTTGHVLVCRLRFGRWVVASSTE